ncbi:MAG: FtsX-like permease family protein [Bacteroidales bacterium]|nr:FtsX-like permease family protein [Bacteroidales bacterium]
MIIKVAWRNIWRNKRRTLITAASVFFAVFFGLIMRSIQIGTFGNITDNLVSSYSGHLQIHKKGYSDEKILNNSFNSDKSLINKLKTLKHVKYVVPRLESFALASSGEQTKGCFVTGISPDEENSMTKLSEKLTSGKYLLKNDKGALIGDKLASFLKIGINDTIVLIGQGYHSVSAAGKYPVRGILHFPSPKLNSSLAYISLKEARKLYSAENKLTGIAVLLDSDKNTSSIKAEIKNIINLNEYEVRDWGEIMPELKELIQSKSVSSYVMLGLLYMIVGFGMLGTIIMMIAERKKEFGLLVSVGMKKTKLALTVFTETVFLGFTGLLAGFIVSLPIILYYSVHPIYLGGKIAEMYEKNGFEPVILFSSDTGYIIAQFIIVFIILIVASVYPVIKILNLNPVKAVRD